MNDELIAVQSIISELPHLILYGKGKEGIDLNEFIKNKFFNFKKRAWEEGVAERIRRIAMKQVITENYDIADQGELSRVIDGIMIVTNMPDVLRTNLHPTFVKSHGLENMIDFSVYNTFSYPYGGYFVNKLDRDTFQSLLNKKEPWNSPELGWNKPIKKQDIQRLSEYFDKIKGSAKQSKPMIEPKIYNLMMKSFENWRKNFLIEQKDLSSYK